MFVPGFISGSLPGRAPGDHPTPKVATTVPGSVTQGSLPNAERMDKFCDWKKKLCSDTLHTTGHGPQPCSPPVVLPTLSTEQGQPCSSSQPFVQGQHSLGNVLHLRDSPRGWETGRTLPILGDCDPPPLLPVPKSGASESHGSSAIADQAGIAVAPQ